MRTFGTVRVYGGGRRNLFKVTFDSCGTSCRIEALAGVRVTYIIMFEAYANLVVRKVIVTSAVYPR